VVASTLGTDGLTEPLAIINPASRARAGVVELPGPGDETRPVFIPSLPGLGIAVVDAANADIAEPARARRDGEAVLLSNAILTARIDSGGRITSLRHAPTGREVCTAGPLNQLVLYEDRPIMWDAWDIDWYYTQKPFPVNGEAQAPGQLRLTHSGPARAEVELSLPLGEASRLTQRFRLDARSPRLDIITRVEWRESRRLLRTLFPAGVMSDQATYGTQFGHVSRPTHRNTTWDLARFEVCAHRFADLSEPGFGLSLLADCKYGFSAHDSVLGLSLLRSPKWPDPEADMGEHEFTYAVMPHGGDWRAAGVDAEGESLAAPLQARPIARRPGRPGAWAPFRVSTDGPVGIGISAFKPAHDDHRLIFRFHESHGGRGVVHIDWNLPIASVAPVDLLERPTSLRGFEHHTELRNGPSRTSVAVRPFQLVTLAIER